MYISITFTANGSEYDENIYKKEAKITKILHYVNCD